jgi:aquaporin Z
MSDERDGQSLSPQEIGRRRRDRLAVEYPGTLDFDNPVFERARLVAECFGTFLLVLAGAGAAVLDKMTGGEIGRAAAVTAPGLTVMAVILFMGACSGAHINPVVSLAFALRGDFPWRRTGGYIVAQLVGAILACAFLRWTFGAIGRVGAAAPGVGFSTRQALAIEIVITVGLVSTILGTASTAQNVGYLSAIGVGGYIVLAGLWSSPVSGAIMNPARAIGPAVVIWDASHLWIYLVGPLAGSLIAVGIAWLLRGPGGDPKARESAQGKMNQSADSPDPSS